MLYVCPRSPHLKLELKRCLVRQKTDIPGADPRASPHQASNTSPVNLDERPCGENPKRGAECAGWKVAGFVSEILGPLGSVARPVLYKGLCMLGSEDQWNGHLKAPNLTGEDDSSQQHPRDRQVQH